ncbi:MAG: cysteine-rich repeat protein, partial [Myxococcota bacterium]
MRTRSYSATLAMLVLVAASASLGACLGDDEEGIFRLDSVAQDSQGGDATDTGSEDTPLVSDTTSNDIVMDSAIEDTAVEDTTPMASCNGNGTLDLDEACDDGNACAQDGCNSCTLETTVVLTALAVSDAAGFDLDNADGDDDRYTGLENKFGESPLLRAVINPLIEAALRRGDVIQLINIGQVEDPTSADEVVLSFIPGVDPACPISASPVPWLGGPATTAIYTDAQAFSMCRPAVVISDTDDSANGIYQATFNAAQPSAPLLFMSAFTVALPTGLGDLDVARTHIEATVEIAANDAVVPGIAGLTDGRLGGIISAATLYRLDTSAAS